MATCKECVHNNICNIKQRYNHPKYALQHIEKYCEHFKDHSRFVELPCKVGDYLYRPDRLGIGKYLVVGIQLLKSNRIDIAWKLVDGVGIPIPYISAEDIGKTVFLTREEAEITLEEWKHDGKL